MCFRKMAKDLHEIVGIQRGCKVNKQSVAMVVEMCLPL